MTLAIKTSHFANLSCWGKLAIKLQSPSIISHHLSQLHPLEMYGTNCLFFFFSSSWQTLKCVKSPMSFFFFFFLKTNQLLDAFPFFLLFIGRPIQCLLVTPRFSVCCQRKLASRTQRKWFKKPQTKRSSFHSKQNSPLLPTSHPTWKHTMCLPLEPWCWISTDSLERDKRNLARNSWMPASTLFLALCW